MTIFLLQEQGFFQLDISLIFLLFQIFWKEKIVKFYSKEKSQLYLVQYFFLAIATINLVTVVSDKLKDDDFLMIIILPIYLIFLSFIVIGSLLILLCQKKVNKNQILLFVGTIFFFISDNTLGRCKFTEYHIFGVKQLNGVVIMATYYIGQYLIAMSSQKIQVNIRPVSLISNESDY